MVINADVKKGTINRNIYGHFSEHLGRCIYGGIYVGENSNIPNTDGIRNDVIEALRELQIPVLRWPGGCFADEYHWKDGIGPKEKRKKMINTHWGGVIEDNHFGTHEFLRLCELLGCEPYITGNVGSGTVREMAEWIEYMTFDGDSPMSKWRRENGREKPWKIKYFGIGNENWGCGGHMRPEYYADLYRRYQTYIRNFGNNRIYRIACGPNGDDYLWTEILMQRAHWLMDGLSLHYYTLPRDDWHHKGSATEFDELEYFHTIRKAYRMDELITRHSKIMDKYDPQKRIGLIIDEWGAWYDVEPGTNPGFLFQQNTMRDAIIASLHFHIFHDHFDRVHMANIAQMVNVLQSVILTDGEKMILTPTYHVFNMYKIHHDASYVDFHYESPLYELEGHAIKQVSATASINGEGELNLSACNVHLHNDITLTIDLRGQDFRFAKGIILTSQNIRDHNTFDRPKKVFPKEYTDYILKDNQLIVKIPKHSIVTFTLKT